MGLLDDAEAHLEQVDAAQAAATAGAEVARPEWALELADFLLAAGVAPVTIHVRTGHSGHLFHTQGVDHFATDGEGWAIVNRTTDDLAWFGLGKDGRVWFRSVFWQKRSDFGMWSTTGLSSPRENLEMDRPITVGDLESWQPRHRALAVLAVANVRRAPAEHGRGRVVAGNVAS